MTKNLAEKLAQLAPLFNDIMKAGGGMGASLGVLHHGEIIHTAHFGKREAGLSEPPNDDTVYYVASLTKAITAAGIAILVERNLLVWDTPLAEYLPDFRQKDDEIGHQANLIDVLSHRTGLTGANALWIQRKQEFMMPKHETVRTITDLDTVVPFRKESQYNNWGYGLATVAIEKQTTIDVPTFDNIASTNMVRNDGSPCPIRPPPNSDRTGLAGAGGAKSSMSDLLQLYKSMLSRYKYELSGNLTNGAKSSSPFRQVSNLFEGRINVGNADIAKNFYALGWVKTVLPERLGTIGMNAAFMGPENMPIIGKNSQATTVLHHLGNLVGAISSVHLVPDSETAIVVMSNTLGFMDTTDWIGQLILETILGEEPHDYMELSAKSKAASLQKFTDLVEELKQGKANLAPSQNLQAYCGRYYNAIGNLCWRFYCWKKRIAYL